MEINIWYTANHQILFIITSFIIDDKKSIAKAHKELDNFAKKISAFNDIPEKGITIVPWSMVDGKYHRVTTMEKIHITAYIRNYIYDFNRESEVQDV
jgi:hypothetical protein